MQLSDLQPRHFLFGLINGLKINLLAFIGFSGDLRHGNTLNLFLTNKLEQLTPNHVITDESSMFSLVPQIVQEHIMSCICHINISKDIFYNYLHKKFKFQLYF
jgi:hypothetical protein